MELSYLSAVIAFVNSEFFIALVTLIVGLVAFRIYAKQKADVKRDAANIVLLEIEDAERQLDKVKQDRPFTSVEDADVFLMKSGSWDKYKYLFVRDLDRNEWDKVSDFYAQCRDFDQAVAYNRKSREMNHQELRINLQRILADITRLHVDEIAKAGSDIGRLTEAKATYIASRHVFEDYMTGDSSDIIMYIPRQAEMEAKRALQSIEHGLSLTSVGVKFKAIVRKRSFIERVSVLFKRSSS